MKIALITGSRSDRNALEMVHRALISNNHDVRWVNVSPTMHAKSNHDAGYMTAGSVQFVCDTLKNDNADLVVIHGDRHEILGAAIATNVMGIPIAHIGGGDITEGSQDDCFRHAITKFSHLHFAANEDAADRIIQMGEEPDRVHVTGCPGIDMVMATPTLGRDETFATVGLVTPAKSILVLFHPNTLGDTAVELKALSDALMRRREALVLLGPNADAGGNLIRDEWQAIARNRPNTIYHDNVPPQVFYSLMKWCDVMVGNSSAGFYEAPCFGIPVIDLGDRQKGRLEPSNVVRAGVAFNVDYIMDSLDFVPIGYRSTGRSNFYGDGHAAERISKVMGEIKDPKALLRKKFQDWGRH